MKKLSAKALLVTAASLGFGVSAHAAVYTQNFTFANGTTNLGDGSTLTTAGGIPASIQNNQLELTNAANLNTTNSFNIPALANSALGFTVSFDITLSDTPGGNAPADGFSFSYGNFASTAAYGEDGPNGTSISWVVDTWNNNVGDQGVRSRVNGANDFVQNFVPLTDGQSITTHIDLSWHPVNGMSLSIAALGGPVFTNRPVAFTGNDAYIFGFGARTGNATETVLIDNLSITTVPETSSTLLAGLAGLGLLGIRRRRI